MLYHDIIEIQKLFFMIFRTLSTHNQSNYATTIAANRILVLMAESALNCVVMRK